jgi:YVTN family beta-propeller protein
VFVSNFAQDTLDVIDGATNTVIATLHVGDGPTAVAVNQTLNRVYVASADRTLTIVDGATLKVEAAVSIPNITGTLLVDETQGIVHGTGTGTFPGVWAVADPGAPVDALEVTSTTDGAHGTATLNADGTVTYTPSAPFTGEDTFTYTVSDGHGGTSVGQVVVTVTAPLAIATTSLPDGHVGQTYHQQIVAAGGTQPYVFTLSGSLPGGQVFDSSSGAILAIPQGTGTFNLTVTVADSSFPPKTASRTFPVNITAATATHVFAAGQRESPGQGGSTTGFQTVAVIDATTHTILTHVDIGLGCLCISPDMAASSPGGGKVYVTNEMDNTVTVLDTATNTASSIAVGTGPVAVVSKPDGSRVYVLNGSGVTSVSVIDTATATVVATVPLGVGQARGMTISPDGAHVYVSTYGSSSVKVIDTATNTVTTTIPIAGVVPLPVGMDATPDGAFVYTANLNGSSVSKISTATNAVVATVAVPANPTSVRIDPSGTRAWVVNATSITVVDVATNAVAATIPISGGARTLEFMPDGSKAFVTTDASIQVVATGTNTVIDEIPLDAETYGGPMGITVAQLP